MMSKKKKRKYREPGLLPSLSSLSVVDDEEHVWNSGSDRKDERVDLLDRCQRIDEYYNVVPTYEPHGSLRDAVMEFLHLNVNASKNKTADLQTIDSFLNNVFEGGDNFISKKKFVMALVKFGITVTDRRRKRIVNMTKVKDERGNE